MFVVLMYEGQVQFRVLIISGWTCLQKKPETVPSHSFYSSSSTAASVKRATQQVGYKWNQSTVCQPNIQSPAECKWTKNGDLWQIIWTVLSPIGISFQQLTKYGCKSDVVEVTNATIMVLPARHCATQCCRCYD